MTGRAKEYEDKPISQQLWREQKVKAVCDDLIAHQDLLTQLDVEIGDGDHGFNISRGANAVLKALPDWRHLNDDAFLSALGKCLLTHIGGASGALYGTLFLTWGKTLGAGKTTAEAFFLGVESVAQRGRSSTGDKTMLDVLVPLATHWHLDSKALGADVLQRVESWCEDTKPLLAKKGRAAYLGERSMGHIDPGACSSMLAIKAAINGMMEAGDIE
ncbi:dihydroxyacetone kinase subunit L [Enterovibrio sp. ZSDZ35]|uniref:Dihydroxyacetone kinase subunit L n=1 Tax=Enterovibrio qingdaonensis TaxID=2899818 RepID=A0ABT5QKC6_9GAMM|nr:dihydroxyacetone kinase subunit DhaL [Enterovibrio sp. ZSDZ35]MDD1781434.1 dihydroxyacetone kinase subunit L [Enterovibrio sp. ZSDZ35]